MIIEDLKKATNKLWMFNFTLPRFDRHEFIVLQWDAFSG